MILIDVICFIFFRFCKFGTLSVNFRVTSFHFYSDIYVSVNIIFTITYIFFFEESFFLQGNSCVRLGLFFHPTFSAKLYKLCTFSMQSFLSLLPHWFVSPPLSSKPLFIVYVLWRFLQKYNLWKMLQESNFYSQEKAYNIISIFAQTKKKCNLLVWNCLLKCTVNVYLKKRKNFGILGYVKTLDINKLPYLKLQILSQSDFDYKIIFGSTFMISLLQAIIF